MFKGYRTVIFNVVMGGFMLIRAFFPDAVLPDADAVTGTVDAVEAGATALWTLGNVVLRAITTTPVFKKEQ